MTMSEVDQQSLPEGWRWVKLGEIAEVRPGQSPPGASYNSIGVGEPFHQGKTEFGAKYIGTATKWTTEPRRFADSGEIVMSVRAPVGPVNLIKERIAIGRGLAAIEPIRGELMTMFAFYYLRLTEPTITGNTGSVFASINKREIQNINILLPPLAEQQRIVRVLDDKLALVDQAKRTAEAQLEAANALLGAYLREAIPYTDGDELPADWRWVKLGDVCELATNTNPKRHPEQEFAYVDIASIDRASKEVTNPKVIKGGYAPSRARRLIRKGDVLVSTTRPNLNAVALVPHHLDNQICSTGICALRPTQELESGYLFAFVRSELFVSNVSSHVNGAMYPAVKDRQVVEIDIPLPPLAEQRRIVHVLDEKLALVEQAKRAAESQLEVTNALSGAYLREAFAGEL